MATFIPATADLAGTPRPFVQVNLRYACPSCGGATHAGTATALLDSGASRSAIPGELLPDHVDYARLPVIQSKLGYHGRWFEIRLWRTQVCVLGVLVSSDLVVFEPALGGRRETPPYPVLGVDSVFRFFHVGFAWSNQPPVFSLEPVGQLLPLSVEMPDISNLPLVDWGGPDGAHYLQAGDGSPLSGVRDRELLTAG